MGLFDQVLSAIENPDRQANPDQLGQILGTVQQLASSKGIDPSVTQTVTSVVGQYVRSALQQQRTTGGNEQIANLIEQFSGTGANPAAVEALFSPQQQQQISQDAASKTGLNADTIKSMLPVLTPIILNLLRSGKQTGTASGSSSNSVLNSFLDSDADGDVDIGDALSFAGRFLNR
ncbi:MAG: DUF937 domain-containing protein [Hydrococcus sp. Prado102]|jgi:hypothetical protein|nr:DUF937 domain-containing protein [Hydrococcus sp. Prado102]